MTDFELSYLVMALLYLVECCVCMPEHAVLFSRFAVHWRVSRVAGVPFAGKRLLLVNPLPFAGEWHVALSPEATVTGRGIITINSLLEYPQGFFKPRLLAFAGREAETCLRSLAAGGCPAGGAGGSNRLEDNAQLMEADCARWVDSGPVRARLELLRGLLALKILCTAQFCWAFGGAPVLLRAFSLEQALLPYLALLFALGGGIALVFARIYRKAHGQSWKSLGQAVWLFVYPPAAMRAVQSLCKGTLPPCHESAVAEALMNPGSSAPRQRRADAADGRVEAESKGAGGQAAEQSAGTGQSSAGMRYLSDITAKLRHRLFSLSLSPEDSRALAKANESLLQAVYANWGVFSVPLLHDPQGMEKGLVCYCPVCGIGLACAMEYCPHCFEVKTLPGSRIASAF